MDRMDRTYFDKLKAKLEEVDVEVEHPRDMRSTSFINRCYFFYKKYIFYFFLHVNTHLLLLFLVHFWNLKEGLRYVFNDDELDTHLEFCSCCVFLQHFPPTANNSTPHPKISPLWVSKAPFFLHCIKPRGGMWQAMPASGCVIGPPFYLCKGGAVGGGGPEFGDPGAPAGQPGGNAWERERHCSWRKSLGWCLWLLYSFLSKIFITPQYKYNTRANILSLSISFIFMQ